MTTNGNGKSINQDGTLSELPSYKMERGSLEGIVNTYADVVDSVMSGKLAYKDAQEVNKALNGTLNVRKVQIDVMQKANLGKEQTAKFAQSLLGSGGRTLEHKPAEENKSTLPG